MKRKPPVHTDEELLQAWRDRGDQDAGAELFLRHVQSISRFFTNKLGADCEDLIQDTFKACVESKDRYRGDGGVKGFLFGIARNKLLHHLRDKARDDKVFDPATISIAASMRSFTSVVAAGQTHERLLLAMRQLPVDTQLMIELHYWEDMSIQDISAIVHLPVNTVKCRMRRGRLELARLLAEPTDDLTCRPSS